MTKYDRLKVELNDKRMNGKTNFQKGLFRWIEDKSLSTIEGKKLEMLTWDMAQTGIMG